jgi:hypothetical protein
MADSGESGVKPDATFAVLLTASAGCAMTVLDANVVSTAVDWRFAPKWDLCFGAMFTQVNGWIGERLSSAQQHRSHGRIALPLLSGRGGPHRVWRPSLRHRQIASKAQCGTTYALVFCRTFSVRRGAGYRGQLLTKRLNTAQEITAASVNGSTTRIANHTPECNRAGHIARATPGG